MTPAPGARDALALPAASPVLDVDALLDDPAVRTLVCCGSGGVGKTTTAASLAVRAAERGRRVVVLTIDPARRLAQSMGLDELVHSSADPERAAQILANPFYQALSTSFSGTQEYMAMEKLGQLRARADEAGTGDLIVVDTPPSRSALDCLDAPRRLGSFLDGRLIRVLAAPARAGGRAYLKFVSAGFGLVTGVLSRLLGAQVLTDVQSFVASIDTLFGGFRERADATYAMLARDDTRFVVVAAPEPDALREAAYFVDRLQSESMPLAGLVLNRVQASGLPDLGAADALAAADRLDRAGAEHRLAAGLLRVHADRVAALAAQRRLTARFTSVHPTVPVAAVAQLAEDVHDLEGLREVAAQLAPRMTR